MSFFWSHCNGLLLQRFRWPNPFKTIAIGSTSTVGRELLTNLSGESEKDALHPFLTQANLGKGSDRARGQTHPVIQPEYLPVPLRFCAGSNHLKTNINLLYQNVAVQYSWRRQSSWQYLTWLSCVDGSGRRSSTSLQGVRDFKVVVDQSCGDDLDVSIHR